VISPDLVNCVQTSSGLNGGMSIDLEKLYRREQTRSAGIFDHAFFKNEARTLISLLVSVTGTLDAMQN
jgi:hypothetical protein